MTFVIDINDVNISQINDKLKTGNYNKLILRNHYNLEDVEILRDLDISNIEIFDDLFKNCTKLRDISALSNWNINKGKSFKNMFENCYSLVDISYLSNLHIDLNDSYTDMFKDCFLLKIIPEYWNKNSKAFSKCNTLHPSNIISRKFFE